MKNQNKIICFLSTHFYRHFPNSIAIARIFAIILIFKAFTVGALFFVRGNNVSAESTITARALIEQTNSERAAQGLEPLKTNSKLAKAASRKASDIIQKNYFAHTTPSGKPFYSWIQESDYTYKSAGENLAISFTTTEDAIAAWMMSPKHRENTLDKNYEEIGIAVAGGNFQGKNTIVIVQLFGEPP